MGIVCEIISIGNELLIGKIQDTNSLYLIKQLLFYGGEVRKITIVKDELSMIRDAVQDAISRKNDYVFTSGGLGPTFDDMTLEGVTMGLNPPQPLELNDDALKMLCARYNKIYPDIKDEEILMKPSRKKMATLPKGSIALYNPEGSAPGVLIPPKYTNEKTKIICMPGIPRELHAIFEVNILPEVKEIAKSGKFYECGFEFKHIGESNFTGYITDLVKNKTYPEIWIKTHPKSNKDATVELHLTSFSENPEIPAQMKQLYEDLLQYVHEMKGTMVRETPPKE